MGVKISIKYNFMIYGWNITFFAVLATNNFNKISQELLTAESDDLQWATKVPQCFHFFTFYRFFDSYATWRPKTKSETFFKSPLTKYIRIRNVARTMQEVYAFKVSRCIGALLTRILNFLKSILWQALIVYPITFGFDNGFTTLGHCCYDFLTLFLGHFVPRLVDALPMLDHTRRRGVVVPVKPTLKQRPHILNGIKVRRLCGPLHNLEILVCKPFLNDFGGVLGIVVMLEDHSLGINPIILRGLLEIILQDDKVEILVKDIINLDDITRSLPRYTTPKFDIATAHCKNLFLLSTFYLIKGDLWIRPKFSGQNLLRRFWEQNSLFFL